jgi:hypothetical protein
LLCAFYLDYVKKYWTNQQIQNIFQNKIQDKPRIGRPKTSKNKLRQYEIYNCNTKAFEIINTLKELRLIGKKTDYMDPITKCNQIKKV